MSNPYDDMRAAVESARATFRAADNAADAMANTLRGRLRHVSGWQLAQLKRELRDFNIHTGRWKEQEA